MKEIIDFLKDHSEEKNIAENSVDRDKLSKSFIDLKVMEISSKTEPAQIKSIPRSLNGQIWMCKQKYSDALGNNISGDVPYIVLIVSGVERFADKCFVRVQPISPFVEFAAADEILVKDTNIVGFEFIVETWNEQPVLSDLLDKYIGYLDIKSIAIDESNISLSEIQKEFRVTEINNSAYLRQSVISLIEFDEHNPKNSNTVKDVDIECCTDLTNIENVIPNVVCTPNTDLTYSKDKKKS